MTCMFWVQHDLQRTAEQPFWQERRLYAKHLEKQKEEVEEEVGDETWAGRLLQQSKSFQACLQE